MSEIERSIPEPNGESYQIALANDGRTLSTQGEGLHLIWLDENQKRKLEAVDRYSNRQDKIEKIVTGVGSLSAGVVAYATGNATDLIDAGVIAGVTYFLGYSFIGDAMDAVRERLQRRWSNNIWEDASYLSEEEVEVKTKLNPASSMRLSLGGDVFNLPYASLLKGVTGGENHAINPIDGIKSLRWSESDGQIEVKANANLAQFAYSTIARHNGADQSFMDLARRPLEMLSDGRSNTEKTLGVLGVFGASTMLLRRELSHRAMSDSLTYPNSPYNQEREALSISLADAQLPYTYDKINDTSERIKSIGLEDWFGST